MEENALCLSCTCLFLCHLTGALGILSFACFVLPGYLWLAFEYTCFSYLLKENIPSSKLPLDTTKPPLSSFLCTVLSSCQCSCSSSLLHSLPTQLSAHLSCFARWLRSIGAHSLCSNMICFCDCPWPLTGCQLLKICVLFSFLCPFILLCIRCIYLESVILNQIQISMHNL